MQPLLQTRCWLLQRRHVWITFMAKHASWFLKALRFFSFVTVLDLHLVVCQDSLHSCDLRNSSFLPRQGCVQQRRSSCHVGHVPKFSLTPDQYRCFAKCTVFRIQHFRGVSNFASALYDPYCDEYEALLNQSKKQFIMNLSISPSMLPAAWWSPNNVFNSTAVH